MHCDGVNVDSKIALGAALKSLYDAGRTQRGCGNDAGLGAGEVELF